MFDNIGSKIKTVTGIMCWIGIIGFIILGIILITGTGEGMATYGWFILFAGPIGTWVASLGMYALGQIAENSDLQTKLISEAIEELKEEKKKKCKNDEQKQEIEVTQSTAKPQIITPVPVEQRQEECRVILLENGQEQCEQCGTIQRSGRLVCWHCGAKFIRNNEWNKT